MRLRHGFFAIGILVSCGSFEDATDADGGAVADGGLPREEAAAPDGDVAPDGSSTEDAGASASERYRADVLANGPVAYWRMGAVQSGNVVPDETAGNNALVLGGNDFAVDAPGIFADDRAVWFGGASQGHPNDSAPFSFDGRASFTLECWARRELDDGGGLGDTFQHLVSFVEGYSTAPDGSTENGYLLYLRTAPAATHAEYGSLDGGALGVSGKFVPPGEWAHYAMVMTGSEIILYVNAFEESRATVKGGLAPRTVKLTIANASNDSRFFRGYLDEIALYPKALSAQAILSHYQIARP